MSQVTEFTAHLPKFSQLDKEDIKAVRSFFPGKMLGRTAAFLSLILLVIGFIILIDEGLKHLLADLLPRPWLFAIVLGLALLAVLAQVLVEWRAERNRRALQQLAVSVDPEQSGYFRIGPYLDTPDDRAQFRRPDRMHEKVLSWIEGASGLPQYLTGDSGTGKSSLLNAFILPILREHDWIVIEARAWQDPEAAVRDALLQLENIRRSRQRESLDLYQLFEVAMRSTETGLLIVLDQFEEFVLLGEPERQQRFAALISRLQESPIKRLSLLLVLRSDYQTFLEDIGLPSLRHGENFYQIARFTIPAASDFLARSGLGLQPIAIDRLLTSAAELDETPGLVRPITLNVIGYVLATGYTVAPTLDAGQLVRRYLDQTVEQHAIRGFAPRILEEMITDQGTKRPRSERELAIATHLRPGEVRAVMNGLGAAGLARPLDRAQGDWELSHDFIARAVARYLGQRRRAVFYRNASYAAPALLTALVLLVAGTAVWNNLSPYRLRSELAELGLTITPTAEGLGAEANSLLTNQSFTHTGSLLLKLGTVRSLNLKDTRVESLEPLKGLTTLRTLNLNGTQVRSLEPIRDLTALRSVDLGGQSIEMVVRRLTNLRSTSPTAGNDPTERNVEDLGPLKGLTALESLDLSATRVSDLTPLAGLTALRSLNLTGTNVENLRSLKSLDALEALNLNETQVENIEPLSGLIQLQSLYLYATKVRNLEPVRGLIRLQSLGIDRTNVTSLEPLDGLPALNSLTLSATLPETEVVRFNRSREDKKFPPVSITRGWATR